MNIEMKLVLLECLYRERQIADAKRPPKWRTYSRMIDAELREYGPRYSPAEWFGDGKPLEEKMRVRYLRAVHKLHKDDLLAMTTISGKLAHLKLTDAGRDAAEQVANEPDE